MKKLLAVLLSVILVIVTGCSNEKSSKQVKIKMATTTSLNDSGILNVLTDEFYKETNIKVEWLSVGSGEAMEIAKSGDVELAFLHSPEAEEQFVKDGYSKKRNIVMSNNFLIVGPEKIDGDLETVVEEITNNKTFVSRGDDSGTHKRELSIFKTKPKSYLETGSGMLDTLSVANEKRAYTLIDSATWIANKDSMDLEEVYYNLDDLKNIYSLHLVSDSEDAQKFIDFVYSDKGQEIIKNYGKDKFKMAVYNLE